MWLHTETVGEPGFHVSLIRWKPSQKLVVPRPTEMWGQRNRWGTLMAQKRQSSIQSDRWKKEWLGWSKYFEEINNLVSKSHILDLHLKWSLWFDLEYLILVYSMNLKNENENFSIKLHRQNIFRHFWNKMSYSFVSFIIVFWLS